MTPLRQWWTRLAVSEVEALEAKALEYGSHGQSLDLIQIGEDLVRISGRDPHNYTEAHLAELGCYFYLRGKVARWTAAVARDDQVSDDTLHDIGVYVRMVQRLRDGGEWPGQIHTSNQGSTLEVNLGWD